MAEKTFTNIRLGLKVDTLENWGNSSLVLKRGELAFATVAASAGTGLTEPVVMVKIGDGEHVFKDLDFNFYANAADVLSACKSEAGLKAFVNGVIADAGIASSSAMEALSGRVTTAEGEIDALQAELNTAETGLKARMTAAETAITTLDGLVGDTAVADQITAAIAKLDLANTYEAKGEAAKVSTALETYKTSNDAKILEHTNAIAGNTSAITAIKDGETIDSFKDVETALAGKEASGAAAQALTDAKAYADGLAVNYDAKGSASAAESAAKAYADGLAGNYDAAGSAAQALTDAKAYTDAEIAEWVGDKTVGVQISNAITALDLANTYDAKGAAAAVDAKLTTHASDAAATYETKTDASAKLTEAKGYTDTEVAKVQGAVDDLEAYVGTIPDGYTEENVIAYINKKAEETLSAAQGGSSETAASVKQQLDNYKSENNTRVKAAEDAIDALEGLVGETSVSEQIENALKVEVDGAKVEKYALATALAAEAETARAAEKANADAIEVLNGNAETAGSVDYKVAQAVAAIMENPDETMNSINELVTWVNDHAEDALEMSNQVAANKTALETLNGDATKAGSVDKKIADAIAAENLGQYATDGELSALAGRVTTVESDLNTETTGLKARMTAAEADIDALETKVGDKTVAAQIEAAIEALKIGDYAKAADLTTAITQHNTDKAALEASIALKANDADLATIAKTGNVNDLVQTEGDVLIFDCGTSV